jgi:hypothetical protein
LHLLHAFDVPYSGVASELDRQVESFRRTHEIELAEFLNSMIMPEEARVRLIKLVELGRPAVLVREYVRDRGSDLVVLGTHGRGAMLEALLGSTAKSILSSLPCDALVVRASSGRPPREPMWSPPEKPRYRKPVEAVLSQVLTSELSNWLMCPGQPLASGGENARVGGGCQCSWIDVFAQAGR